MQKKLFIFNRETKLIVGSNNSWDITWDIQEYFQTYDPITQSALVVDYSVREQQDGLYLQPSDWEDPYGEYTYANISKISGYTKDSGDQAISGVSIEFIKDGQVIVSTSSDGTGYFIKTLIPQDMYKIKLSKQGYVTVEYLDICVFPYTIQDFGIITMVAA